MDRQTVHDNMTKLLDVIFTERECAKQLDIDGMIAAMNTKEDLLRTLLHVKAIDDSDKPLAARIREENRRNAFLFKSALGWIRQTMEFFGQKSVHATYSSKAHTVSTHINGRLLSGRI